MCAWSCAADAVCGARRIDLHTQIATQEFAPQLESSWQFSVGASLVNGIQDMMNWIQDTATAFATELYLAVSDPGGAS